MHFACLSHPLIKWGLSVVTLPSANYVISVEDPPVLLIAKLDHVATGDLIGSITVLAAG